MTSFFISLYCVFHPEAQCAKPLMIPHIVKTANFTGANALYHCEFLALLIETESEHGERIYHINMKWLNHVSVLKKVFLFIYLKRLNY
jgi:hypothetical protein